RHIERDPPAKVRMVVVLRHHKGRERLARSLRALQGEVHELGMAAGTRHPQCPPGPVDLPEEAGPRICAATIMGGEERPALPPGHKPRLILRGHGDRLACLDNGGFRPSLSECRLDLTEFAKD